MPTIIYKTGKREEVPYSKGSEIKAMLEGTHYKTPTPEQKAFLETVEGVTFEITKQRFMTRRKIDPDPEIVRILKDERLHGKARFDAVAGRIRERVAI